MSKSKLDKLCLFLIVTLVPATVWAGDVGMQMLLNVLWVSDKPTNLKFMLGLLMLSFSIGLGMGKYKTSVTEIIKLQEENAEAIKKNADAINEMSADQLVMTYRKSIQQCIYRSERCLSGR